ncbi:iron-sulfur cluster assembly scaffold protein [bacterium]|nr:iron-sulfur cluster assembly scaffold protein [bacterium]
MYSKEVLEHFKNPRNQGQIDNPDVIGQVGNPVCGDVMKIYLKINQNSKDINKSKIEDIKFETLGCAAAIACSSVVTENTKGKTLEAALKINKDLILKKLGGLPLPKVHCSMLALEGLEKAIKEYLAKH